jgi:hypothetical protein
MFWIFITRFLAGNDPAVGPRTDQCMIPIVHTSLDNLS